MKIVGLIAEYNPFHNGHLYHIQKAKEVSKADAAIVVMSGNYVQRGAPAIMPKHLRAEVALKAGASLVIEIPVCYATGSAEYFAAGAISLLEGLGCIDSICFGSECGDYHLLHKIAAVVADEPEEYRFSLQEALRQGNSFPRARQMALKSFFKDPSIEDVLEQPNNILGIEYMKALYLRNSSLGIYTIRRKVSGYHDQELTDTYSSASAIRKLLAYTGNAVRLEKEGMFDEPSLSEVLTRLESQVPPSCIRLLEETHRVRYPVYSNDFSLLVKYRLMTESRESLVKYMDVTEELANRIMNHLKDFITFEQFCDLLKTKDMTYSRICRCLFHILLNIRTSDLQQYESDGHCQYARVLGFRKDSTRLMSQMKRTSSIPLLTKITQTESLSDSALHMLEQDIFAADLYESVLTDKFKMPFITEYQQQIQRV